MTGFAIDKGVDVWFNVREDSLVKLSSRTFEGDVEFHVNMQSQVKERHWGDYARSAKYALRKRFELSHGIEGVIQGSLPVGGLSSSAAVLIAYVMAFAKANDIALQPFEVVKIASEAEREYIGLNNGLLDLVRHSVENGCGKDAPGNLAHYMVEHTTMHAWPMSAGRFDIGSLDTYYEAVEKYGK